MKILSFALLILGAVMVYGAKFILEKALKKECGDREIATLKTIGLFVALIGAIIIFVI